MVKQPLKKNAKPVKKVVRKNDKGGQKSGQKSKLKIEKKPFLKPNRNKVQKYGTSKLEIYFATHFLDRVGVSYVYEYHAKEIGRYYDFAVIKREKGRTYLTEERNSITSIDDTKENVKVLFFVEVDGDYHHGNPEKYPKPNNFQKRNMVIDEMKNSYCRRKKIPLLRIWESEIYDKAEEARKKLASYLVRYAKDELVLDSKKK